ncbi:phospholipid carrier-dependent glycosyltransferase [Fontimonas sp. SYSU GA230001]|uniref:phospholipid carrier-dependent glycosyltransferase n=1 Tax=Fontimonas sp. SYSU GA230001 TaxID=3142450 RepID=UPI0032B31C7B
MNTVAFVSLYGSVFLLLAGFIARRTVPSAAAVPDRMAAPRLIAWLALGVLLRLPLLWASGFHYDTGTYKAWALTASDPADPLNLYKEGYFADYPPFYMYVLAALGTIARVLDWGGSAHFTALIKLPALLCDIGVSLMLLRVLREQLGDARGWGLASLYWLNPAMIFTGALWGQTEALLCLLIVLGWRAWRAQHIALAALVFAIALAFKPQGALYAGIFGIALLISGSLRQVGTALAVGGATFALIVLPFAWSRAWDWLPSLYLSTAETYNYMTVNAYNLWALLGWNWKKDAGMAFGLPMQIWALIDAAVAILAAAIHLGLRLRRTTEPEARGALMAWAFVLATVAFFMLAPRMHERYILMLLPMLLLLDPARVRLPLILAWTCASLANLAYVYYHYIDLKQIAPADTPFIRVSSAINVAVSLLTLLYWQLPDWPDRVAARLPRLRLPAWDPAPTPAVLPRWTLQQSLVVAGFVLAALAVGLYRVGTTNYPIHGLKTDGFSVEYRYERPVVASKALIYAGESSTRLRLEQLVADQWVELIPERELADFYKLHEIDLDKAAPSTRYRWHATGKNWRVNELGLLDGDGRALVPETLDHPGLSDEQARALIDEPATWLARRGYMASPYFDEIYHGRTAYEFLHRLPIYETTHPPLGKWLISAGIDMLGMTPFGWRFVGVLASALTVGVLAWAGWLFNGTLRGMLLTGGLGLFEFSRFTIGRYATIDAILGLFILLGVLFLWQAFGLRRLADWRDGWRPSAPLLAAGASLGAAIAVKWSALYAGIGVLLFFVSSTGSGLVRDGLRHWRPTASRTLGAALAFAAVPALIYYLSYIPFLRCLDHAPSLFSAEGFWQVVKSQRDIYNYHSQLTSTHPFSSPFWSWPLDLKPLWIYTGEGEPRSVISILGNPLIWWGTSLLVCAVLWRNLRAVRSADALLVGSWASLYLPWALIDRAIFNYHYYPAVLVLIPLLGNYLLGLGRHPRLRWLPIGCLITAGLLFAWFYPTISGQPAPKAWFASLRWLPTWWML